MLLHCCTSAFAINTAGLVTTASMSVPNGSPPLGTRDKENDYAKDTEKYAADNELREASLDYGKGEDILGQQDIDPALNAKMHIVNNVRDLLCL